MIPKKIHITWKTKDILERRSLFLGNCIQKIVKLAPEWDVFISDDNDVDNYLRKNLDIKDYLLLKQRHIVEKTDVWRLLKLYNEGGLYIDIDRLCNISLDSIIAENTKLLLPTCGDYNFSQDIMCSAPNNPIYIETLLLNLKYREQGSNSIYHLGPQTYMHGVTKTLLGEIVDVNPPVEIFDEIRKMINLMPFIVTYKENGPYDTIIYNSKGPLIDFDHETEKRNFYGECKMYHWTGDW